VVVLEWCKKARKESQKRKPTKGSKNKSQINNPADPRRPGRCTKTGKMYKKYLQ